MADDRLKNIAGLFKDGRTRTILLTTLFVLLVAVVIGIYSIHGRVKGVEAAAGVTSAPGGIQSLPFNAPNEEYARLQEQQNKGNAKNAEQTGGSAIPTIIRADSGKDNAPAVSDTGLGFSGLSREQSDAGTFNAKEFGGNAKNCPIESQSPLGTPVYDKNGRLIGYLGADGKVRDVNGTVIGTMGPDGLVRDASGNVIGQASRVLSGTPIYDTKNCSLIGRVGEDGQVRDASGKVPGILGPDGILRNTEGKVLGQAAKPAYTPEGKLIGFSCTDGKVRDENGNVIGTVGPDGVVRDLNGNIIGRVGAISPGSPVYGPDGKILGYVGPDGKVRDANGNIVGSIGADGLVKDANGRVIGTAGKPTSLGKPIYGPDGKLLGYVDADGNIRDANGNIIGKVGPDGKARDLQGNLIGTPIYGPDGKLIGYADANGNVRDANGNIVGKIGADGKARDEAGNIIGSTSNPNSSGTPVYGPDGKVIGYIDAEGNVRDANGNIIGKVGPDGKARDLQGNVIGSTSAENQSSERSALIRSDIPVSQQVEQAKQSMTNQANQLLAAWVSPTQQLVQGTQVAVNQNGMQSNSASTAGSQSTGPSKGGAIFVKAGTVFYGVIDTAVNSDEPGPVMATIVSGPYKGGKLLGSLTYQKQAVMLSFNILTLNNFPASIPINAVAIDQDTARTGLSTETNNHYLYRYGAVFASAFIQGYGQAFQTSGSTISSNGLSTQASTPDLSPVGKFFVALGNVGQQFSDSAKIAFNTPATVHVASGTAVGLLFLADARLPN